MKPSVGQFCLLPNGSRARISRVIERHAGCCEVVAGGRIWSINSDSRKNPEAYQIDNVKKRLHERKFGSLLVPEFMTTLKEGEFGGWVRGHSDDATYTRPYESGYDHAVIPSLMTGGSPLFVKSYGQMWAAGFVRFVGHKGEMNLDGTPDDAVRLIRKHREKFAHLLTFLNRPDRSGYMMIVEFDPSGSLPPGVNWAREIHDVADLDGFLADPLHWKKARPVFKPREEMLTPRTPRWNPEPEDRWRRNPEDLHSAPTWVRHYIQENASKIAARTGANVSRFQILGKGSYGVAFAHPNPLVVVKVTSDESEGPLAQAVVNLRRRGVRLDGICGIYGVFRGPNALVEGADTKTFVIVKERVLPLTKADIKAMDAHDVTRRALDGLEKTMTLGRRARDAIKEKQRTVAAGAVHEYRQTLDRDVAPVMPQIAASMVSLLKAKILFADAHWGNIGRTIKAPPGIRREKDDFVLLELGYSTVYAPAGAYDVRVRL